MNFHFRFSGIVILFFAIITSCKKSSDDAPRDPDKLRISEIIITGITSSGGKSEVVTSFVYDDQQRVDAIVTTQLNLRDTTKQYFYNGADQKPYKSRGSFAYGWGDRYYTYDRTGTLIHDSVKSVSSPGTDMLIRNYRYHPGKIIVRKAAYQTLQDGTIAFYDTSDSVELNGSNIAEAIYLPESPFGTGQFVRCTYDDKINPLNKLNIAVVNALEGINFPGPLASGICKNNIIEYSTGYYSPWSQPVMQTTGTKKLKYTYTKEGLPETCVIDIYNTTYTYKFSYEAF